MAAQKNNWRSGPCLLEGGLRPENPSNHIFFQPEANFQLLSTQGPDPRLFFCAAFTSYYEESDRGQTITTKKKQLNHRIHTKKHRNTSKVSLLYSFYRKISKNNDI